MAGINQASGAKPAGQPLLYLKARAVWIDLRAPPDVSVNPASRADTRHIGRPAGRYFIGPGRRGSARKQLVGQREIANVHLPEGLLNEMKTDFKSLACVSAPRAQVGMHIGALVERWQAGGRPGAVCP